MATLFGEDPRMEQPATETESERLVSLLRQVYRELDRFRDIDEAKRIIARELKL